MKPTPTKSLAEKLLAEVISRYEPGPMKLYPAGFHKGGKSSARPTSRITVTISAPSDIHEILDSALRIGMEKVLDRTIVDIGAADRKGEIDVDFGY